MNLTQDLINALRGEAPQNPLQALLTHAHKNKVDLELLRRLNLVNEERRLLETRRKLMLSLARQVEEALRGLNHAFIKLRKPLSYVPADIDVLVDRNCVAEAMRRLQALGFKLEVREPYSVTLVRRGILDVYVHPNVANMVFLDGFKLLRHTEKVVVEGVELTTVKTYAEAVVTAAHAIYKEQIYTLNDHYVVKSWAGQEAFKLARELKATSALQAALLLSSLIEEGKLEAPYKLPLHLSLQALAWKVIKDPASRSTLTKVLDKLRDPRLLGHVKARLTRTTY